MGESFDIKIFSAQGTDLDDHEDPTKDKFPVTVKFFPDAGVAECSRLLTAVKDFMARKREEMTAGLLEGSDSAPFLREYFQKQYQFTNDLYPATMEAAMELAFDPEKQAALKQKGKEYFNTELKPLLEKSFAKHDKDDSKTLCKEEAAILFKNISADQALFSKAIVASVTEVGIMQGVAMMTEMCGGMMDADSTKEATDQMKEAAAKQLAELDTAMDSLQKSYLENADARNAEAFKVLDTSGDGTLQLDELIAAYQPESEKGVAFIKALGLQLPEATPPTEPAGEAPAECAQQ